MRLNFSVLLIFFLFSATLALSQETRVLLNAPDYEGKDIYIWIEDDYFTRHLSLIEQGLVKDSSYSFELEIEEISKLRVAIDFQYGSLFIEPGSSYSISFPKKDEEMNRSLAWNTQVNLSIEKSPPYDINQLITQFNRDLDIFFTSLIYEEELDSNERAVIKNFSTRESLLAFKDDKLTWDSTYQEHDNDYFRIYREYASASISQSLGEKKSILYDDYLKNREIKYNNPEFVGFFQSYHQNFFDFYQFYPLDQKLIAAINSDNAPKALDSLVSSDSQTGDKRSQELVLMKGIFDLQSKNSNLDSIAFRVMEWVLLESDFEENKEIADHYIDIIKRGKVGSLFPDFQCISSFNDTSLFSSYADEKLIYVQVFASWSSSSIAEMELMKQMYKRYNSKVKFISINIDPKKEDFDAFYGKHRKYKWDFVWVGQHPDILSLLSIYDVPIFYLLDGDMTIERWPALAPSTGIEKTFYELEIKEREDNKYRFWEDQTNKSNKDK